MSGPDQHLNDTYAFLHFEMHDFFSSRYTSHNRSTAGRIINQFIKALNEHNTLPKLVVVILDDDLITDIPNNSSTFMKIRDIMKWLFRQFEHNLKIYKDFLPVKAKMALLPHVLWIAPPVHKYFRNNRRCEMLTDCMQKHVKMYQHMSVLKLIKIWDPEDSSSYIYENDRFTSDGLVRYWLSVDSAIRYWNVAIFSKLGRKNEKKSYKDVYHWQRKSR